MKSRGLYFRADYLAGVGATNMLGKSRTNKGCVEFACGVVSPRFLYVGRACLYILNCTVVGCDLVEMIARFANIVMSRGAFARVHLD